MGLTDPRGYHMEVTEFDYKGMNKVVYEENGVTIRSWPAIHCPGRSGEFQRRVERSQVRVRR